MNKGAWLFAVFAGGYILFELSMLHRLGYRMEADHILEQMISAEETARLCGEPTISQQDQFQEKFDRLLVRYRREQEARDNGVTDSASPPSADNLERRVRAIREATKKQIETKGCKSKQAATWLRRYTIYAGKK